MKQTDLHYLYNTEDCLESIFSSHGPERPLAYIVMLGGMIAGLAALPLIKVDVTVRAHGWVRSTTERTQLRPVVSGYVTKILAKENDRVVAGAPILTISSKETEEKLLFNKHQQMESEAVIGDLLTLVAAYSSAAEKMDLVDHERSEALSFKTGVVSAENSRFRELINSNLLARSKAQVELARYTRLAGKGIASKQTLDNATYELKRAQSELKILFEESLSRWHAKLKEEKAAQKNLITENALLTEQLSYYTIRSPSDGVLIGFAGIGAGGIVTAGQSLGEVSPDDDLRIETLVSPKDIGLVRIGQSVRVQVDAFPYTQWGVIDGIAESMSGDMLRSESARGSTAFFKVLIKPHKTLLHLPNGFRGELKKGMTVSARFLVARRTLLQILYEDVSQWLDPNANQAT